MNYHSRWMALRIQEANDLHVIAKSAVSFLNFLYICGCQHIRNVLLTCLIPGMPRLNDFKVQTILREFLMSGN